MRCDQSVNRGVESAERHNQPYTDHFRQFLATQALDVRHEFLLGTAPHNSAPALGTGFESVKQPLQVPGKLGNCVALEQLTRVSMTPKI
jgi:hypothetical protein